MEIDLINVVVNVENLNWFRGVSLMQVKHSRFGREAFVWKAIRESVPMKLLMVFCFDAGKVG